jgi:hypothetical protein
MMVRQHIKLSEDRTNFPLIKSTIAIVRTLWFGSNGVRPPQYSYSMPRMIAIIINSTLMMEVVNNFCSFLRCDEKIKIMKVVPGLVRLQGLFSRSVLGRCDILFCCIMYMLL